MKKHIVAALIASVTVISGAQAGVPVAIDANPEWAVEAQRWTERLKQWQDTVNHYQKQINAYKQELLTKTGIRDVQDWCSLRNLSVRSWRIFTTRGTPSLMITLRTRKPPCLSKPDHYWPIIR
uniref:hypothetical protein n=1 Tax=Enterobacter cloacae complex sp. TaxID=2027919 RepID=UPI003B63439C